jgi:hypothetical protein
VFCNSVILRTKVFAAPVVAILTCRVLLYTIELSADTDR